MLAKKIDKNQLNFLQPELKDQLNPRHPLYILANVINWEIFEKEFKKHYCENNGRPAKPIRLMDSLILLKHLRNISDETVV